MKKILTILFLPIFLFSCKKSDNNGGSEGTTKKIERALICFEKPMISKTDKIFIGVRYFKNYTQVDKITVTLNGKKGIVKGPRITDMEGTNYFFEFPPVSNAGDAEIELIIENDQGSFSHKKTLRIIDNYHVETVWDKLDNSYVISSFPYMYNATSDTFSPGGDPGLGYSFSIGTYMETNIPNSTAFFLPFISGINGKYTLNYDDSKKLKDITILNGEPLLSPEPTYQDVVNDVNKVYGPVVAITKDNQGKDITRFQTNRFNILVYERKYVGTAYGIVTVISLK